MTREEATKFYATPAWKAARLAVLRRDGFCCTRCGRSPSNRRGLTVHHRELVRSSEPAAWLDETNLESLCRGCHAEAHRTMGMDPARLAWRVRFGI